MFNGKSPLYLFDLDIYRHRDNERNVYFKNSFLLLYLSRTSLVGKLETQEISQFLKRAL